jgi:predicted alpha/beta superfamily hydrolase
VNRTLVTTCLALAALGGGRAQAQDGGEPLEIGRTYRIASRALGEERVIDVALPARYTRLPDRRYPVLFVLDAEYEGHIAMTLARFFADMTALPPVIVVGVRNVSNAGRMRDMTPPPIAGFQLPPEASNAGGADRFLAFFADELIPWVEQRYQAAPMRVLVGHSLGGLFALHALAHRPQLFTGYLVMEPSAWWNNQRPIEDARAALRRPDARRVRLMMVNSVRLGVDTTRWGGDAPMVRHLATTGETHGSMALAGMMAGLRAMFADFLPTDWRPGTRPIAMLERYDSLARRVGYDVPIPSSAFARAARMSVHSRFFDDAERVLARMESVLGPSSESRELRDMLTRERATPADGFVPLEFSARRPTPADARAFLGRWEQIGGTRAHSVEVRASGDTIVVHDRIEFGNGDWFDADDPVIQVTADGALEWGLPFFRGIAALVVLTARVQPDGTLLVRREPRGWVPRQGGPEMSQVQRFRRVTR